MTLLVDDLATRSQNFGEKIMTNLLTHYSGGLFITSGGDPTDYPRMTTTPAALLATLAKYTTVPGRKAQYLALIEEILTYTITTNTNASKLFLYAGTFNDIEAVQSLSSMGWIMHTFPASSFSAGLWDQWLAVMQANCTYLDTVNHNTTFYVNGNINSQLIAAYWMTASLTPGVAKATYLDMYERAYAFLIDPASVNPTWAGYGLYIDVTGTLSDWSDYQCHLSETTGIGPPPTYDPIYTQFTLDILTRFYVLNRDVRILRLINSLANKNRSRINTTTWILDGTGGSRQNGPSGMWSGYYHVNRLIGNRLQAETLESDDNLRGAWDIGLEAQLITNSTNGTFALWPTLDLAIAPVREVCAQLGALGPWAPVQVHGHRTRLTRRY